MKRPEEKQDGLSWLNGDFKEFAQRCADKCSRHLGNLLVQEVIRFTGSQVGLRFPN